MPKAYTLPHIKSIPVKFQLTAASLDAYERGADDQGYIFLVDMTNGNIHMLPAFNRDDGKVRLDKHGMKFDMHIDSIQPLGANTGDAHMQALNKLGLGDKGGVNGLILGGGLWKGSDGKIREIRNRSSSQNMFSVKYTKEYMEMFKRNINRGHKLGHAIGQKREIPTDVLGPIMGALKSQIGFQSDDISQVITREIRTHFYLQSMYQHSSYLSELISTRNEKKCIDLLDKEIDCNPIYGIGKNTTQFLCLCRYSPEKIDDLLNLLSRSRSGVDALVKALTMPDAKGVTGFTYLLHHYPSLFIKAINIVDKNENLPDALISILKTKNTNGETVFSQLTRDNSNVLEYALDKLQHHKGCSDALIAILKEEDNKGDTGFSWLVYKKPRLLGTVLKLIQHNHGASDALISALQAKHVTGTTGLYWLLDKYPKALNYILDMTESNPKISDALVAALPAKTKLGNTGFSQLLKYNPNQVSRILDIIQKHPQASSALVTSLVTSNKKGDTGLSLLLEKNSKQFQRIWNLIEKDPKLPDALISALGKSNDKSETGFSWLVFKKPKMLLAVLDVIKDHPKAPEMLLKVLQTKESSGHTGFSLLMKKNPHAINNILDIILSDKSISLDDVSEKMSDRNKSLQLSLSILSNYADLNIEDCYRVIGNPALCATIIGCALEGDFDRSKYRKIRDDRELQQSIYLLAKKDNFTRNDWLAIKDNQILQDIVINLNYITYDDWQQLKNNDTLQKAIILLIKARVCDSDSWNQLLQNKVLQVALSSVFNLRSLSRQNIADICSNADLQLALSQVQKTGGVTEADWDKIKNNSKLQKAIIATSFKGDFTRNDWRLIREHEVLQDLLVEYLDKRGGVLEEDWQNLSKDIILKGLEKAKEVTGDEHKLKMVEYFKQRLSNGSDVPKVLCSAARAMSHHASWYRSRKTDKMPDAYLAAEDYFKCAKSLLGISDVQWKTVFDKTVTDTHKYDTYKFLKKELQNTSLSELTATV
ncbi:MAG: hypothetical protein EP298_06115 [Gammaproteobacteria bacterium]|nr:MAG: hypothetical protein EP298_06115 [Gammaproteobacteria bacterium]UTW41466.1 hypothetical protein KFE69_08055 [bacterium SCSIO 12844]